MVTDDCFEIDRLKIHETKDIESSESNEPKQFIYSEQDMDHFRVSPAKKNLLKFTTTLGQSCISSLSSNNSSNEKPYRYDPSSPLNGLNPGMASLHGSLRAMAELWLTSDYFPPEKSKTARFGNPMFRAWHDHLISPDVSTHIVNTILDCHLMYYDEYQNSLGDSKTKDNILKKCSNLGYEAASKSRSNSTKPKNCGDSKRQQLIINILPYFHSSFGHPTRLDYGTGHESSFLIFLFVLYQIGPLSGKATQFSFPVPEKEKKIFAPIALSIFSQYLQVTRSLQTEYMLEPAGSHGVWGLDDYHCLPFYFGACQLIGYDGQMGDSQGNTCLELTPASIHDKNILETKSSEMLYFSCISYIKSLKKGVPFGESSPMLNDISYLKSWEKVSKGLLKLYEGEVLNKFPVVQHFVFGDFFPG